MERGGFLIQELIMATTNKNKIEEIEKYLPDVKIKSLLDFPDLEDVEETGLTYKENSFLKASYLYSKLGIPVIAEDSGISVDCLQGSLGKIPLEVPSIYSARYASIVKKDPSIDHNFEENNRLLLKMVEGQSNRKARYNSTFCLIDSSGNSHFFESEMEGIITDTLKGENGFAYDFIFNPLLSNDTYSKLTYAEMTTVEKNKYSHRIKSINKLINFLECN